MATFESITWQAVGVLAVVLSALGAAVAWTYNKVYSLGRTDQRINNIEYILDVEFREKFHEIDRRFVRLEDKLDKRFDKIDERFKQIDAKFDKLYDLLLKKQ